MAGKKQVMDMRSTTSGVSLQESDEQQRNWTKQHWEKKAKDSLSNYDPTRAKLNFEVVKGGIYNPQIEMFARFKTKSSFHKTKRII